MAPDLRDAPNLNYLFAGLVVEELIRYGIEWFVVCPGSRSAPLAWAIASHPRAKTVVHHDERGAAFHALGIAKGTGKPAVFVCTSGTAVANALPAVVEASYSGVPMILLTADRPPRLQGTGANQTINQIGIYREFVRWEHNFVVAEGVFRADHVLTIIDHACAQASGTWSGPVHLNCMMDEPLAPEAPKSGTPDWSHQVELVTPWIRSSRELTRYETGKLLLDDAAYDGLEHVGQADEVIERLAAAQRGLIIAGELSAPREVESIQGIADKLGWPIVPDIASTLRLSMNCPRACHYALHFIDRLFHQADLILHVGGNVTSRRLLEAISGFKQDGTREYIRVSPLPNKLDQFHNVSLRVVSDLVMFDRILGSKFKQGTKALWSDGPYKMNNAVLRVLESAFGHRDPVSESGVANLLSRSNFGFSRVFLGNSMPIRDMDLYGVASPAGPRVGANRGASGIDGNIATAVGIALATEQPVTAVIGDLAALHDLNSLALVRELKTPFVLVVVNNDGGGIFSLLPIAKHTEHFEKFFGTPHGLGFEHAAAMYGLRYERPATNGEFSAVYVAAMKRESATMIEVRTDRAANAALHRDLDARIRAALDAVNG